VTMKKSPFISSADFDKIQAQKRKKFNENMKKKYNETPTSSKKKKTFQTTLNNGKATNLPVRKKQDVLHPEVVEYKTRRLPRKKDKEQLGFDTQRFGSLMLADQLSLLNKAREREDIREQERKNLEIIERRKYRAEEKGEETKKQREQAERDRFARNYQARDYIGHVTNWTASQVVRKKFNRNGIRIGGEWQSRGYTDRISGMPAVDNTWSQTTRGVTRGTVKGSLTIGNTPLSKGKLSTKNRIAPSLPEISTGLGSGSTGLGSGSVVMPLGLIKIKRRGGKYNVYS